MFIAFFATEGHTTLQSFRRPLLQCLHRRTGNSVTIQVVVDVDQHTLVSLYADRRRGSAIGNLRSTTTDSEASTLQLILCAVLAPCRM
jgi:ribosomal protein L18